MNDQREFDFGPDGTKGVVNKAAGSPVGESASAAVR